MPCRFKKKKLKLLKSLKLDKHEIDELQHRTIEQSNCNEWTEERSKKLTASHFGKLYKLQNITSRNNSIIAVLHLSDYFHGTVATR